MIPLSLSLFFFSSSFFSSLFLKKWQNENSACFLFLCFCSEKKKIKVIETFCKKEFIGFSFSNKNQKNFNFLDIILTIKKIFSPSKNYYEYEFFYPKIRRK